MKKIFFATLFVCCLNNANAQITPKKDATYEYAVLVFTQRILVSNTGLEVVFENKSTLDLYNVLKLDTVKVDNFSRETLLLKCLNYMDKQGFEMASSYDVQATHSIIFRRKKQE